MAAAQAQIIPIIPFPRDRPAIVFDWDDTLFPSTFLNGTVEGRKFSLNPDSYCRAHPDFVARLHELEGRVQSVLTIALDKGNVAIVTNAQAGWVENCITKYVPNLAPIIARVQVISARTIFEGRFAQPEEWKLAAFRHLLGVSEDESVVVPHDGVTLRFLSIGDSNSERQAAWSATGSQPPVQGGIRAASGLKSTFANNRFSTRSIKLQHHPTIEELFEQLGMVEDCIAKVLAYPDELDLEMTPKPAQQGGAGP
jgi:hypothetical protein